MPPALAPGLPPPPGARTRAPTAAAARAATGPPAPLIDVPVPMSAERFDELVSDALDLIPAELAAAADNVVFLVAGRTPRKPDMLGLYEASR